MPLLIRQRRANASPRALAMPPIRAPSAPAALLIAAATLAALAPDVPAASLDDVERARADALARALPWTRSRAGTRETEGGTAVRGGDAGGSAAPHALGVQTLEVEGDTGKGASPGARRARVYQHDHASGRTRRVVLDLATDAVLEARALDSPHLPLSEPERRWALRRLASEAPLLERLREEQRRRGAAPFTAVDELDVKASVYEPTDPAHPCARERCALLSLFDATRTVFAIEPLVRFRSGAVTTLELSRGRR